MLCNIQTETDGKDSVMPKRTKKQQEEIDREVEERVEEEIRRRKGEEEYHRQYQDKIDRGLCGRCGSRRCVCE